MLSFLPSSQFPKVGISGLDLVVHFFFYSVFSFLLIRGNTTQIQIGFAYKHPVLLALIVSFFYGLLIEILQGTVFVSRGAELSDVIANTIGSFVGWFLYLIMYGSLKNYMPWKSKKTLGKTTEKDHLNSSLLD